MKRGDIVTGTRGSLINKEWIVGDENWLNEMALLVRNKGYSRWKYYECGGYVNDFTNDFLVYTRLEQKEFLVKIEDGEIERSKKMPRIFRYLLYAMLIILVWEFTNNVENILYFLINMFQLKVNI